MVAGRMIERVSVETAELRYLRWRPPSYVIFGGDHRATFNGKQNMCLAVPGQVESIFDKQGMRMGKVNFGGVVKEVCLAYLPDIQVGDYTLVHVGFAISQIDEQSAQETLRTFEEIGLLQDELQELRETEYEES